MSDSFSETIHKTRMWKISSLCPEKLDVLFLRTQSYKENLNRPCIFTITTTCFPIPLHLSMTSASRLFHDFDHLASSPCTYGGFPFM